MTFLARLPGVQAAAPPPPTADWGFNFRATEAYGGGGDRSNEVFIGNGTQFDYPSSAVQTKLGAGVNAGYVSKSGINYRDRVAGNDVRLRGSHYVWILAGPLEFRIDVPTGQPVKLSIAGGDPIDWNYARFRVYDGPNTGSPVLEYNTGEVPPTDFRAANDVQYNAADWVTVHDGGDTAKFTHTYSNYLLFQIITQASGNRNNGMAHLRIEA